MLTRNHHHVRRAAIGAGLLMMGCAWAQDFDVTDLPRPGTASAEFGAAVSGAAGLLAVGDPGANIVYVYRREGDQLVLDAEILLDPELLPVDFTGDPRFGAAVDLAVGAYCLDLTTCPGLALIIGAPDAEIVDIWSRNSPSIDPMSPDIVWEPVLTFITSEVSAGLIGDLFGTAVALSEDYLYIGAPAAEPDGEVYVFSRDGESLVDILLLEGAVAAKGTGNAGFGTSIDYSKGKLGIGAPNALLGGAVQLHNVVAGNLGAGTAVAGKTGDQFGSAVSISGDMVAAGTPGADLGMGGAAVFPFQTPGNRLQLAPPPDLTNVGTSIALQGDMLIAGAQKDGNPVAVLRNTRDSVLDIRLNGNLVAGANPQMFMASDAAAGQVSFALHRDILFSDSLE